MERKASAWGTKFLVVPGLVLTTVVAFPLLAASVNQWASSVCICRIWLKSIVSTVGLSLFKSLSHLLWNDPYRHVVLVLLLSGGLKPNKSHSGHHRQAVYKSTLLARRPFSLHTLEFLNAICLLRMDYGFALITIRGCARLCYR